ncbi:hypothetical protein KW797_01815 [Candidatus Parcubacteria bacterium]|nr:hypothetical protein [Candidatus Parcubacteria bacterium]
MTERIIQLNREFLGNNGSRTVFLALMFGMTLVFLCYSYFMGSIIFAVVARKDAEVKARELRSAVGILEVEYLKLSSGITLERAHSLGFKEATAQVFAARKPSALSLRPAQ